MLSLTMWSFENNINHSLIRPKYQNYRCNKKECDCDIPKMCKGKWRRYQKDIFEYMDLKFKDTYKNGN
jgi:hypothetical protein